MIERFHATTFLILRDRKANQEAVKYQVKLTITKTWVTGPNPGQSGPCPGGDCSSRLLPVDIRIDSAGPASALPDPIQEKLKIDFPIFKM